MQHPRLTTKPLDNEHLEQHAQRLAAMCIADKSANNSYIELHKIDDSLSRLESNELRGRITQLIKLSRQ